MVEFETITAKNIPFGRNNFIEVARKKAVNGKDETEFISISRGFFQSDDSKSYRKSVTIPIDEDVRSQLAKELLDI